MKIWLATILGLTLIGCSSGSGDGASVISSVSSCSKPDLSSYFDNPGETINYRDNFEATYSDGRGASGTSAITHNYGEVSSIPTKYSYSGDITGPYLLNVKTEDCVIDGFIYESSQGDEIVDDDLTTFTRIDAQTKTGSDEPTDIANIAVNDTFAFSEDSTLFDSATGLQVGNTVITGTLVVNAFEEVIVPAGTYNAVKVAIQMNSSNTIDSVTDTAIATGFGWFSVDQDLPLKLDLTLSLTISELGLTANATTGRVLTGYSPASNNTAQLAVSTTSNVSGIPGDLLINRVKQSLLDLRGK